MRKRIASVTLVVLLMGLMLTALPGTGLEGDKESEQPLDPPGTGILQEEETTQRWPFPQALADQLGISMEELEAAIQGAQNELIDRWVERRAAELKERLSQVEPGELIGFLMGRSMTQPEGLEQPRRRMTSLGEEWTMLQPQVPQQRYMRPYYQSYPCNCTCYCNIPRWYYTPSPPQLEPLPQPWKFQSP